VTRDPLDVAPYLADLVAQLEAMAIAAHLDQVAYLLGMAKAEIEISVRVNAVAEAERAEEESYEPAVGPPRSREAIKSGGPEESNKQSSGPGLTSKETVGREPQSNGDGLRTSGFSFAQLSIFALSMTTPFGP
jgi:hypothetical protein